VNGTWWLEVEDLIADNTGTLKCAALILQQRSCYGLEGEPTPTPTPTPQVTLEPTPTVTCPCLPTPTLTTVPPYLAFDFNGDGFVGPEDLLLFLQHWHQGERVLDE
jgi:hypothetical protein